MSKKFKIAFFIVLALFLIFVVFRQGERNKEVSIYLQQYLNLKLNIIVNKYGETYYVNDINSIKNLIEFMKEYCT
jgi:hypothetical protein